MCYYVMSPLGFVFGVDTIVNNYCVLSNLNSPEEASELYLMAHLNETEGQRYLEKTLIIGCDPYLLTSTLFCPLKSAKHLPQLSFLDIYIYLVHNPSPYTGDFKSTNAHQYAVAGWVNDTKIWHLETKNMYVITGHVSN